MTWLLLSSRGLGVAGPSRSQESSVLARSAPSSVEVSTDHALARLEVLPGGAHTFALHGPLFRGLVGRVPGLASRALAPRPVRDLVDAGALARTFHAPPLPACGLGLQTATGPVKFARGLDECARALLVVTGLGVTIRCHKGLLLVTSPLLVTGSEPSLL